MLHIASNRRCARYAHEAFTLIELMIAITIIGLIVGGLFVVIPGYMEQAKLSNTQTTLRNLKVTIMNYKNNTGEYPETLRDLVTQPTGDRGQGWRGPYFKKLPEDGWGKPFVYQPTPDGVNPYELYSYGGRAGRSEPKSKRVSAGDV